MLIPALASLTWIAYLFAGAVLLAFFALLVYKAVSALRGKKTGCCCGSKGKKLVKDFHKLKRKECCCCHGRDDEEEGPSLHR